MRLKLPDHHIRERHPLNTDGQCCVCCYQFDDSDWTVREVDDEGEIQWIMCEACYVERFPESER